MSTAATEHNRKMRRDFRLNFLSQLNQQEKDDIIAIHFRPTLNEVSVVSKMEPDSTLGKTFGAPVTHYRIYDYIPSTCEFICKSDGTGMSVKALENQIDNLFN